MMGERSKSQGRFFYRFDLEQRVPADHLLRKIDAVLDLSKLRSQLRVHTGRCAGMSVFQAGNDRSWQRQTLRPRGRDGKR